MTPGEHATLRTEFATAPQNLIVQEFAPPSRMDGLQVDLRPFLVVTPRRIVASEGALTRGAPAEKAKMNVHQGGFMVPVWILEEGVAECAGRELRGVAGSPTELHRH